MSIDRISISGYRSIQSLVLQPGQLTTVTGANGSGKSNLYRALRLLASTASGQLTASIAREGGFDSLRWAGPKRIAREPVRMQLGFASDRFVYSIDLGLPIPSQTAFVSDPEIKRECLWNGSAMDAKYLVADRKPLMFRCRNERGRWEQVDLPLARHESMLTALSDPQRAPELIIAREYIKSWRFYDTFRVDVDSPARRPAVATQTPVMADDGCDLAAALQTIIEIGDSRAVHELVLQAFPNCQLKISQLNGMLRLQLGQPGMRDFTAAELSDGTLRFLLLLAALLSPRPPDFLVLNEPEASLHPSLIPTLARLIRLASENSQVIVVSHNTDLIQELNTDPCCVSVDLEKRNGETVVSGGDLLSKYAWNWPAR